MPQTDRPSSPDTPAPARESAMFPLGSPLLPGAMLPLHIFEPRYRALARRCTDNDETFGVVMIERGSEVGGGDVRSEVGCTAEIVQYQELDDGRWVLLAAGRQRIRISEWLADDPYPRAMVHDWPDGPGEISAEERHLAVGRLRRLRAQASEIGALRTTAEESAAIDDRLALFASATTEASQWCFALGSMVPAGAFDQFAMLAAANPADRLTLISGVLDGVEELLGGR